MSRLRNLDPGRVAILVLIVVGAVTLLTRDQWDWFFGSDDAQRTDVVAERIELEEVDPVTERLYRISPDNGSEVSCRVEERLAGAARTAVGTSTVVAGDVKINLVDPSLSEVGPLAQVPA